MKARIVKRQEVRREKRKRLQQKRISDRHDWWSFIAEQDLGCLVRSYTTEEAVQQLRAAGLHVRPIDGGFIGGSHVDASSELISIMHNSFRVRQKDGILFLRIRADREEPVTMIEAVTRILETVQPEPSIPSPSRPNVSGPVEL